MSDEKHLEKSFLNRGVKNWRKTMALRNYFRFEALLLFVFFCLGKSQTLQGNIDSPLDGQINALAVNGSKVYVGGTFTRFGYSSGTGVLLDTSSALPDRSFPKCDPLGGQILASVPDGMGGYYIGGQFLYINGIARKYVAHIRADHTLDSLNPAPNGYVTTLSLTGNRLYVGGVFTTIAGQSRGYAAAFDTGTRAILPWNPNADNIVTAIQQVGNVVYLGGYFSSLNVSSRFLLASVDASTGAVTTWAPINAGPSGSAHVTQFIYSGGYLYACGLFSIINSVHRNGLVKLDAIDTVVAGWNPAGNINGGSASAVTMALSGGYLYVGGSFTNIGGIAVNNLAAIDLVTGAASGWSPNPSSNITALTVTGGYVYASGNFSTIGGRSISNLAKIDTGSGLATTWDAKLYNYPATSTPYTLSTDGGTIFAGGSFNGVGLTTRNGLGAIDLSTGRVTSWNPNVSLGGGNAVNAIALAGDKVFAGGAFTFINGHSISNLAALDTLTGTAFLNPSWLANVSSTVYALKVFGNRLYVGGYFTSPRSYVEAVSISNGALLPWNPNLNSGVFSIATTGSKVYLGGNFTLVGATTRNFAAAFDTVTDALAQWNPNPDNYPSSMDAHGSTVYLGGSFFNVNSQPVKSVAAVDMGAGTLMPGFDAGFTLAFNVTALAFADTQIIIGGAWSTISSQPRQSLAYLNASTGGLESWSSHINNDVGSGTVNALEVTPQTVFVGGSIASLSYFPQSNLAVMTDPNIISLPVEMVSFVATLKGNEAILRWNTATETNNYGFEVERMSSKNLSWQEIGFVKGSGTSNAIHQYKFEDPNLQAGVYDYRIKQVNTNGSFKFTQSTEVRIGAAPRIFALNQNYPNPFNPTTTIEFTVPTEGKARLKIYDMLGRDVTTLFDGEAKAGLVQQVKFDASALSSGTYLARLEFNGERLLTKMTLLK